MNYIKYTSGGYIVGAGVTSGEGNIGEGEYRDIIEAIREVPEAPEGYMYRLREDLTWELCEIPVAPDPGDDEMSDSEIADALEGIL